MTQRVVILVDSTESWDGESQRIERIMKRAVETNRIKPVLGEYPISHSKRYLV